MDRGVRLWYPDATDEALRQRPIRCSLNPPLPRGRRAQSKDRYVQVLVRDNNVDQALKALKKKMQREGY